VIKTRSRSRKSSAGFDTTKLFIGAEGTLGIVTEVTIRLAPVLPTTVATVQFPNVRKASEAVIEILNTGIGIRAFVLPSSSFPVTFPLLLLFVVVVHVVPPQPRHSNGSFFFDAECIELVDAAFMRATISAGNPARKYEIAEHLFFKLQGATPAALSESVEVVKKIVKKNGLYSCLKYAGDGAKAWLTDVW
jgi:D-lactate dehydrogenase (cytochrome)